MKLLWLVLGLYANSAIAQGTLLWTCHDSQTTGAFSATFQVNDYTLGTGEDPWQTNYLNEMSLTAVATDPWGTVFSSTNALVDSIGGGGVFTWHFDISMYSSGLILDLDGERPSGYSVVTEFAVGQGELARHYGNWTWAYVPEPDATSLLLLGLGVWVVNRRRASGVISARRCTW